MKKAGKHGMVVEAPNLTTRNARKKGANAQRQGSRISMWTAEAMARKIDYEKRRFDNKRTLNIKDESEFRKGDVAARWLARRESEIAAKKRQRAKPITTTRKSSARRSKASRLTPIDLRNFLTGTSHF